MAEICVVGKRFEERQNELRLGLFSHEDGHFIIRDAGFAQSHDLFGQFLLHCRLFIVEISRGIVSLGICLCGFGENVNAYEAAGVVLLLGNFFLGVKPCDGLLFVQAVFVKHLRGMDKKPIVETHNPFAAAIIAFEMFDLGVGVVAKLGESVPIASAPAVNALLDIADNHAAVAGGCGFAKEMIEVFPLQVGGVLKLVDHDVPEIRAGAFEDEGHFVRPDEFVKEQGGVGQQEGIAFAIEGADFAVDVVEQTERVEFLQTQFARIDTKQLLLDELAESGKSLCKTFYPSVALPYVFLIEFRI